MPSAIAEQLTELMHRTTVRGADGIVHPMWLNEEKSRQERTADNRLTEALSFTILPRRVPKPAKEQRHCYLLLRNQRSIEEKLATGWLRKEYPDGQKCWALLGEAGTGHSMAIQLVPGQDAEAFVRRVGEALVEMCPIVHIEPEPKAPPVVAVDF
jgi:hypothetical protein